MVSEEKQVVIDAVIEQLKKDFENGDYTVLDELLGFIPINTLIQSLPEEEWSKYPSGLTEDEIHKIILENPNQGFDICSVCGAIELLGTMDEVSPDSFDLICNRCKV